MLPKRFRLKRSTLFPKTLAAGKVLYQNPCFIIRALPRSYESSTPTKFGFIISKKVSNRASVRNRIKRRLREIVRQYWILEYLEQFSPYISVVVITRKPILEASYTQLQQSMVAWLAHRKRKTS